MKIAKKLLYMIIFIGLQYTLFILPVHILFSHIILPYNFVNIKY